MLALLLGLMLQAREPVQVMARLTAEQVAVGETTVLRIEVETGGARARIHDSPTLPAGLELVSTRDADHRQFSLPGGTRRFISREFVLRSRVAGRYRIPAIQVSVEDRSYSSPSLLLMVTTAPAPGGDLRDDDRVATDDVRLRAWLDADTVFVGQQVTLNVEVGFARQTRLRLRRAPEFEPPTPSGFWVQDLTGGVGVAPVTTGDGGLEVQTFRRALVPITPGRYEIPAARVHYEMRRGILYAPETHTLESDPLELVVLPVPEDGRPRGYGGAVGRYEARGWLEPDRVPAGEAAVLTVEIRGLGHVRAAPPPVLPQMAGMDVSAPGERAEPELRGDRLAGAKRFTWVLVPREAGVVTVPEIRYPYFDPDAGRFATAHVPALDLIVEPGHGVAEGAGAVALRYLKPEPAGEPPLRWVRSPWFAAAQAAPLLLLAVALGLRRRRGGRPPSARALSRERVSAIGRLDAMAAAGDPAVHDEADGLAREWLAARLDVEPGAIDGPGRLEGKGVAPATADALRSVLARVAAARYSPDRPGPGSDRALVRALANALERVDREADRPVGRRRAGAAAGVGLILALLAAPAAAAPQASTFAEAVAHFDAGRAEDAALLFQRHLDFAPGDAAGWHNLGTAHHHAGRPGHATWAWLVALRLDPRDADTRLNLRVAGTQPELVRLATPRLPLRTEELLVLASLAWLLAGVAAAARVLRRRRGRVGAAVAAALIAALLAGLALESERRPDVHVVLETTALRAGPVLGADPVVELAAGAGAVGVGGRDGWVRVRTLDGLDGWLDASVTARVDRP